MRKFSLMTNQYKTSIPHRFESCSYYQYKVLSVLLVLWVNRCGISFTIVSHWICRKDDYSVDPQVLQSEHKGIFKFIFSFHGYDPISWKHSFKPFSILSQSEQEVGHSPRFVFSITSMACPIIEYRWQV